MDPLPGSKADQARQKNKGGADGAARLYDPGLPLPTAAEAERCVLSCMMQAPEFAVPATRLLRPEDFSVEANSVLFDIITRQFAEGRLVDPVTIAQLLIDRSLTETISHGYLAEVLTAAPSPGAVGHYVEMVREKSAQRRMVLIGFGLSNTIMKEPEGWKEAAMEAVNAIIAVTTGLDTRVAIQPIREATVEALDAFERAYQNKGHVPEGYSTGFTHLDRTLWGIRRGDNVMICGRPSMGKTALAMCVLLNMACGLGHYQEFYHNKDEFLQQTNPRQGKLKVLMVCLESPPVKMATRAISVLSGITMQRMRDGLVDKSTFQALSRTGSILTEAEFYLWDAPGISVEELEMELKAFKARHKDLAVVCVDHCGLLRAKALGDKATDYQRTSYISNRLMLLWRQVDVVGMPLWQLSREVEKRGDKRPRLSDLRDSGNLEQDATHVIATHRPHYYDEEAPEDEALLCVLKNRDGAVNPEGIAVKWDGTRTQFSSTSDKLFSNDKSKRQDGGGDEDEWG